MLAIAFGKVSILLHLQEYLLSNHIVVQHFFYLASGCMISDLHGLLTLLQPIYGQNIVKRMNGLSFSD